MTRPTCARCEREVDAIAGTGSTDGSYEVRVVCHGHVDVFVLDLWTRRALSGVGSSVTFERAFVGGIGKPVDVETVDAVPRNT